MNILLVEDEPPILRDLQYIIESYREDFAVVATALDGQNAALLLEQNKEQIDVVITDIHIPIMNGLELIACARQNAPEMDCIIISGYSEFEYAKRAVRLGVADYLLKPVNEEELYFLLRQIYIRRAMEYLRGERFTLKHGPAEPGKEKAAAALILLRLSPIPVNGCEEERSLKSVWDSLRLKTLFEDYPGTVQNYCVADGEASNEKYLLLFHAVQNSLTELYLKTVFQHILCSPFFITAAVNLQTDQGKPAKVQIDELRAFMNEYVMIEKSQLLILHQEKKDNLSPSDQIMLANEVSLIAKCFSECNLTMFFAELEQLVRKMKNMGLKQKEVAGALHMMHELCMSSYHENPVSQLQNIPEERMTGEKLSQIIFRSETYERLLCGLKLFYQSFFDVILEKTPVITESRAEILCRIDHYIVKHCFEQLNTKSIAEKFGFTPAYFSRLFQDYKKISPTDYIVRLRMEKAMELFQDHSELKIKEIAAHVGYQDSLYFSKVFRKYTGKSPKQYLKQKQK